MSTNREGGFSLIEILVALGVLGVIMSGVAATMIVGLKVTQESNRRLTEAAGVSFTSAYFVPDVVSAHTVLTGSFSQCIPASVTPLVQFRWEDQSGTQTASYFLRTVGAESSLVRKFCSASVNDEFVMVRGLRGPPGIDCDTAGCASPRYVSMTLDFVPNGVGTGRSVQLSASRRLA